MVAVISEKVQLITIIRFAKCSAHCCGDVTEFPFKSRIDLLKSRSFEISFRKMCFPGFQNLFGKKIRRCFVHLKNSRKRIDYQAHIQVCSQFLFCIFLFLFGNSLFSRICKLFCHIGQKLFFINNLKIAILDCF